MNKRIKILSVMIIMFFTIMITSYTINAKSNKININKSFTGFLRYCMKDKAYDKNQDGYLSVKEIKKIDYIGYTNGDGKINLKGISKLKYIETIDFGAKYITNLKEIKRLKKLKKLRLDANKFEKNMILDLRSNHKLEEISISEIYGRNSIKLGKNNIKKLYLNNINGGAASVGKCTKLERVEIGNDKTSKKLIVKNNKHLKSIYIYEGVSALKRITLKSCKNLKEIDIDPEAKLKKIKKFEMINSKKIQLINLAEQCPNISSFILKNLPNLKEIDVTKNNFIKSLKLENVPRLTQLYWENGKLENIEITGSNTLKILHVGNNNFVKFEHPELKNLYELYINKNKLTGLFNMNNYPKASNFYLDDNNITEIYGADLCVYNGTGLSCNNNQGLKLIYLPDCYFLFFNCNVPYIKAYITFNEGEYEDTAEINRNYDLKK